MAAKDPRFQGLAQAGVHPDVAAAVERLATEGRDDELCRIDALAFAEKRGLDVERAIDGFVHAAKLGLFEMSWNTICPGCGGVLETSGTLKSMTSHDYACSMCVERYEPSLDEMVEVSFTISPSVRRIEAHEPDRLPLWEYYRQLYFSNGLILPEGEEWRRFAARLALEAEEVPARQKVILSLRVPAEWIRGRVLVDQPIPTTKIMKLPSFDS